MCVSLYRYWRCLRLFIPSFPLLTTQTCPDDAWPVLSAHTQHLSYTPNSLHPTTYHNVTDIPLVKAVAGVRVGYIPSQGGFIVNPTAAQMAVSQLDLMMAGTADAVLMIEGFCDWLSEEQMLEVRVCGVGSAVCEGHTVNHKCVVFDGGLVVEAACTWIGCLPFIPLRLLDTASSALPTTHCLPPFPPSF